MSPKPIHLDSSPPTTPTGQGRIAQARELMLAFAERTGLSSDRAERRYLWTDAFAVCNLFGLEAATGEARLRELALILIDRVHQTLGHHREDDARSGWLSGLSESEGAKHPTQGGLRIGKPLPERARGRPLDQALEWDRDGQYFHYLTRWMHALDIAARRTGERSFHRWSQELAEAAFAGFVSDAREPRMVWKMSIDLSQTQVPSTGQHDPLDGLITCAQIEHTGKALGTREDGALEKMVSSYAAMMRGQSLATADPLGIGGLLAGAYRLSQLAIAPALVSSMLEAALPGLDHLSRSSELQGPASRRLAFRELGLSIGLSAVEAMGTVPGAATFEASLEPLARYRSMRDSIVSFWLDPFHQSQSTWSEHLDINTVMLATSLAPAGYLDLPSP